MSESADFTPWLAENLDVLGEELGMSLTLTATEVPVGDFRLDIQAVTPEGRTVIIENQLEKTDHGHLGQLLVYASGLEAAAVVWVAPQFRDDHRRTLDWLNERTDTGVDFFGVEVAVVQIGDEGPRAPVFEVVSRPNDWQKGVKERGVVGGGRAGGAVAGLNDVRQDFFSDVLSDVVAHRPGIRLPARGTLNWVAFSAGPWGNWGLVLASDFRVEVYLDGGDLALNKALFDELREEAALWEQRVGQELVWERLDGKRASRISAHHPVVDLSGDVERAQLRAWAVKVTITMHDAMNDRLRARARALRDASRVARGAPRSG